MSGLTRSALSLGELAQQTASEPQGSGPAYLASAGVIAAVIIGVFFGIGFSLLTQTTERTIGGSGPSDRGSEVNHLKSIDLPDLSSDAQSVPVDAKLPPSATVTSHRVPALAQSPTAPEYLTSESTNPARDSASLGALSSAGVPAVKLAASEATHAPPATVSPPEPASGLPVATAPAMPSASLPLTAEVAELLARGDSLVVAGEIASARAFYERAANTGDARAAVRMGASFDPAFLSRAGLRRTFGDPVQARFWYRRALDLAGVGAEPGKMTRETK
jgi:hypothetical protein